MDLIKREDAIKAVEEYDNHLRLICKRRYTKGHEAIVLDIVAILKDIPSAEKQGEWIPCSERLPEVHEEPYYADHEAILHESDYVLTCCKYGKGFVYAIGTVIHDEVCDSYEWSGLYDYAECVIDDTQVLAWMPLPEPWKGADNE